jgi:hypothetical protein
MVAYCANSCFACEWTSCQKPQVIVVQPQCVVVQEVRPQVVYVPVVVYQPQPVVVYSQPVATYPVYVYNPWVRYRY